MGRNLSENRNKAGKDLHEIAYEAGLEQVFIGHAVTDYAVCPYSESDMGNNYDEF